MQFRRVWHALKVLQCTLKLILPMFELWSWDWDHREVLRFVIRNLDLKGVAYSESAATPFEASFGHSWARKQRFGKLRGCFISLWYINYERLILSDSVSMPCEANYAYRWARNLNLGQLSHGEFWYKKKPRRV